MYTFRSEIAVFETYIHLNCKCILKKKRIVLTLRKF